MNVLGTYMCVRGDNPWKILVKIFMLTKHFGKNLVGLLVFYLLSSTLRHMWEGEIPINSNFWIERKKEGFLLGLQTT